MDKFISKTVPVTVNIRNLLVKFYQDLIICELSCLKVCKKNELKNKLTNLMNELSTNQVVLSCPP